MSHVIAFLDGMRSTFDLAPEQKIHKANFIKLAEAEVVNLDIDSNINDSWKVIASCQNRAFNEICHNHHEDLEAYECITTRW